jgi:hypothetical protein
MFACCSLVRCWFTTYRCTGWTEFACARLMMPVGMMHATMLHLSLSGSRKKQPNQDQKNEKNSKVTEQLCDSSRRCGTGEDNTGYEGLNAQTR